MENPWDVVVLGAGPGGLLAAWRLARSGLRVLVLEKATAPGGLCAGGDLRGFWSEQAYHAVAVQDQPLLNLASELGLNRPRFRPMPTGFLREGRWSGPQSWSLAWAALTRGQARALDLVRPRASAFWDQEAALPWLQETFGSRASAMLVRLLEKKFGAWAGEFSLLGLYGRLARERSGAGFWGQSQKLACFPGASKDLIDTLEGAARAAGAEIRLSSAVTTLSPESGAWQLGLAGGRVRARRVLSTLPLPLLLDLLPPALGREAPQRALRFLDAAVVRLLVRAPNLPYYFCSLPGADQPFVALVQGSRLRPRPDGLSLLYLSRYAPHGALESRSTLENQALKFLAALPSPLGQEQIVQMDHFEAPWVQPFFCRGYLGLVPRHRSPWSGLYLSDSSQIFPGDRGLSATCAQADRVSSLIREDHARA